MLKKLHVLLLVLLAAVCFTATAWADYDYIEQYGVMVTPNTEDGSLLITVKLEWTPLEELPYGQERTQRLHPGCGGADGQHRAPGLR